MSVCVCGRAGDSESCFLSDALYDISLTSGGFNTEHRINTTHTFLLQPVLQHTHTGGEVRSGSTLMGVIWSLNVENSKYTCRKRRSDQSPACRTSSLQERDLAHCRLLTPHVPLMVCVCLCVCWHLWHILKRESRCGKDLLAHLRLSTTRTLTRGQLISNSPNSPRTLSTCVCECCFRAERLGKSPSPPPRQRL